MKKIVLSFVMLLTALVAGAQELTNGVYECTTEPTLMCTI